jgi:hypothetical protein|tara:strand:+ start:767 stop:973 length:207 start_codon:yes stop_codon:yes gene_type:complete
MVQESVAEGTSLVAVELTTEMIEVGEHLAQDFKNPRDRATFQFFWNILSVLLGIAILLTGYQAIRKVI